MLAAAGSAAAGLFSLNLCAASTDNFDELLGYKHFVPGWPNIAGRIPGIPGGVDAYAYIMSKWWVLDYCWWRHKIKILSRFCEIGKKSEGVLSSVCVLMYKMQQNDAIWSLWNDIILTAECDLPVPSSGKAIDCIFIDSVSSMHLVMRCCQSFDVGPFLSWAGGLARCIIHLLGKLPAEVTAMPSVVFPEYCTATTWDKCKTENRTIFNENRNIMYTFVYWGMNK